MTLASRLGKTLLALTLVAPACARTPETRINRANRLFENGQYRSAAKAYGQVSTKSDRQAVIAYSRVAEIEAHHLSDPKAALQALDSALDRTSDVNVALTLARRATDISVDFLEDRDAALARLSALVERFPTSAPMHLELGRQALAANRLPLAEEHVRFALADPSLEADALELLASTFVVEGRFREATDLLAELTGKEIDDDRRRAAYALAGHCHEILGEITLAADLYSRAGLLEDRARVTEFARAREPQVSARP